MDGRTFDELIKVTTQALTRRGALGLLAGAALSGLAWIDQAEAKKKRRRKNKKRKKKKGGNNVPPAGGCSSDAECSAGQVCQGGSCVPVAPPLPPPPECTVNNDCGINETCQNGVCVPNDFECAGDDDCDDNEECQGGVCHCPEIEDGRCIRRCDVQDDCPGESQCQNLAPEPSPIIVDGVCVDQPFLLCSVERCTSNDDCQGDELCVMQDCDGLEPTGVCYPFSVFS